MKGIQHGDYRGLSALGSDHVIVVLKKCSIV